MKIKVLTAFMLAVSLSVFALPGSSGKLAGTETAYIDTSYVNIGLMDSTFSLKEIVSVKSNLTFDALGLYNVGVKAGYRFRNLNNLRVAAGYTWFSLNEAPVLTRLANAAVKDSGITIDSLDLNIKGNKIYAAVMMPLYGFNLHTNFSLLSSVETTKFMKGTLGLEKTFLDGRISLFANGGMFFNLPESSAATADSIYVNKLKSKLYADGGFRFFAGKHFNLELGVIYPGVDMSLGTDSETGEAKNLNLPVVPVFNIAYRL